MSIRIPTVKDFQNGIERFLLRDIESPNIYDCLPITESLDHVIQNSFWLANNHGYVRYVGNSTGIYMVNGDASDDVRVHIRPVIIEPDSSYVIGDIYTVGRDRWGLPLRWMAVGEHMLIIIDNFPFYMEKGPCLYKKCGGALKRFIDSSFSAEEINAIRNNEAEKVLTRYEGHISVYCYTEEIPNARYVDDRYIQSLDILPREHKLTIGQDAFKYSNLRKVTGLDYHTVIKPYAFCYTCIGGDLVLGNVDQIGESAFEGNNIEKVRFEGIVGTLDMKAFQDNKILKIEFAEEGYILRADMYVFSCNRDIKERTKKNFYEKVIVEYHTSVFGDAG